MKVEDLIKQLMLVEHKELEITATWDCGIAGGNIIGIRTKEDHIEIECE
jgi:hypothetical protein